MEKMAVPVRLVHDFTRYDHLGSEYPYYWGDDPSNLHVDIASALSAMQIRQKIIDPVGIIEMLSRGYMLGQRTLVKDLQKTPWRARPDGRGGWEYADVPAHGTETMPIEELVREFRKAIEKEAVNCLHGLKRVGVLLSGGMDSRIVAGTLKSLQLSGEYAGDVVGLTWGVRDCRDVVYSEMVARQLGWERIHFELNPEMLRENIEITGKMGAEFAPFHLHALPIIAELKELQLIIGGSYGDSVGRGEYSGTHVESLRSTVSNDLNSYGFVRESIVRGAGDSIEGDAYSYRKYLKREKEYQYREVEYQMHCIRRRTQAVVACIGRKIPFYQMFTAPDVFGLVWKLDPSVRNDRLYAGLLKELPGHLGDIPWARTGRLFGISSGPGDHLPKEHHQYGRWLRNELHDEIVTLVDNDAIRGLGVFNNETLDQMLKLWPRAKTLTSNVLDGSICWLASLSVFVQRYQVKPVESGKVQLMDRWNAFSGLMKAWTYQTVRERFRA